MPDHYGKTAKAYLAQALQWIKDNPQHSPAAQAQLSLGNAEFFADILPYMDMDEMHLVDPSKAKLWDDGHEYQLQGLNTIGTARPQVWSFLEPGQGVKDVEFAPDNVYAIGARNARPELYAHEFRHESPRAKAKMSPGTHGREEQWVRNEDLYHAMLGGSEEAQQRSNWLLADMLYSMASEEQQVKQPRSFWYQEAARVKPEIIKAMEADHRDRNWLPTSPIKK